MGVGLAAMASVAWKDQPKVFSSVQEPEEEENE
jgi:hypothetical protein